MQTLPHVCSSPGVFATILVLTSSSHIDSKLTVSRYSLQDPPCQSADMSCVLLQKHHTALSQETNTTVINSIFRAALVALQRPVAALLPFFAVMHSLRVMALAGEVLLTTGGHRAVITSRELGMHLFNEPSRHPLKWSALLARSRYPWKVPWSALLACFSCPCTVPLSALLACSRYP